MMLEGIYHKCGFNDCYCLNENELKINLHTNKSVKKAVLMCDDPYSKGISGQNWTGNPVQMHLSRSLSLENIFSVIVKPEYKRLQYYFVIYFDNDTSVCLLEDGIHQISFLNRLEFAKHYFKFGWMNDSDICIPPKWVENTVWYQILPDRFCRVDDGYKANFVDWNDVNCIDYKSMYGGNIKGIDSKLEYLSNLGITGIYFNPIFKSSTNHKYNTDDYLTVDPAFGSNDDFANLVKRAHSLGIKVMIDAVFNHTSRDFFAFKDVLKNGQNSLYYNWYYINTPEFAKIGNTKDGRYYSFAFVSDMPKLNTNNKAVVDYFTDVCKKWISMFDIDGIRFDVGNEISHSFIKHLNLELKSVKPDIFLLGEIWTDSSTYLAGDEYDSVMNYPFMFSLDTFFKDKNLCTEDFVHQINYCYSLYKDQTNRVIFNQLDSHDVGRIITRSGSYDSFIQQLSILMTMPGSPCIYYGTELALDGQNDPYNRKPMPWKNLDCSEHQTVFNQVKALIAVRKLDCFKSEQPFEFFNMDTRRLIHYTRGTEQKGSVYINDSDCDVEIHKNSDSKIVFSHKYRDSKLQKGGVLVIVS